MMLSFALSLALAAPIPAVSVPAVAERNNWYACLEDFTQVAMASSGTPATIALQTEQACAAERKAFQLALFRSRTVEGDAAALTARFAAEDRAAYEYVIALVDRLR